MKESRSTWIFAPLLLCATLNSQAAITCATADYNGTYAFFTSGYFLQLPPAAAALAGPFAQAGTFTSDGQGNVTIASTASYNGFIQPANVPAKYVIQPDCTIAFSLTLPPPLGVPSVFEGVLSQNNAQLSLMVTNPGGATVVGTHVKQYVKSCKLSDFTGAYALDLEGHTTAGVRSAGGPVGVGAFRRVGMVTSDGAGRFTAVSTGNYNGNVTPENFSGAYNLDSNCVLSLTYSYGSAGDQNISIGGSLTSSGNAAMVMITTSGWTVSGTLKAMQQ
jgi:hypothetical protein